MSRQPSPRQKALNFGVSSSALATAIVAPPAAAHLIDGEMGDAASRQALSRLNEAVAQLKAMTVAPMLRKAIKAIGDENPAAAADWRHQGVAA